MALFDVASGSYVDGPGVWGGADFLDQPKGLSGGRRVGGPRAEPLGCRKMFQKIYVEKGKFSTKISKMAQIF